MKFARLIPLLLLAACRLAGPGAPAEDPSETPDVASATEARSADAPTPDGPRLKTVIAQGCAITGPRAIVCASDEHASDGATRWQPLAEDSDPAEHYAHIAAHGSRRCALIQPSGRISCWSTVPPEGPKQEGFFPPPDLEPIRGALDVALLEHATCALLEGGEVKCWGDNRSAQLGDGTRTARGEPGTVELPAPAVDIEGSHTTACALLETGSVHCWGSNDTAGDRHRVQPEPIQGLPPVRTLESTQWARLHDGTWARWKTVDHIPYRGFTTAELVPTAAERFEHDDCWLLDGALWCEGSDDMPATKLLDGVLESDLGFSRSGCLRRSDRSVWCLGSKLPLFCVVPETEEHEPTRVPGLSSVTEVVATWQGACALHDGGAVSCWGAGQHVPHDERQQHHFIGAPQRVALPGPAQEITATGGGACARVAGTAHCWGRRGIVHDLGPAVALATRAGFACADTGTVLNCLHSTHETYELPRELPRLEESAVSGNGRRCHVRRGRVECSSHDETVRCPVTDSAPDACTLDSGAGPRPSKSDRTLRAGPKDTILVGGGGTCVLSASGVLQCNSAVEHWLTYPGIDFDAEPDIVSADAGVYSVCAIARDGALRCWLASRYSNQPGARVDLGIDDAVAVSLGARTGYVIREDGTLWSWGPNAQGERGLGGWAWKVSGIPVQVDVLGDGAVMPDIPEHRW